MHNLKAQAQRLCAGSLLISTLLVSVFALNVTPTMADPGTCDPTIPITTDGGSCSVGVTINTASGGLTVANDTNVTSTTEGFTDDAGNVTLTGVDQVFNFKFASQLIDARGSTAGWKLEASSDGLIHGTGSTATILPLKLTTHDSTSSCITTCVPALADLIYTNLGTLTTTPRAFISTGDPAGTVTVGDYNLVTDGTFTMPAAAPAGTYDGNITVTLSDTF